MSTTKKTPVSKTTQVGALKYADLLQQSQQDKEGQEVAYKVKKAKLDLQADILATEQSLAEKQACLVRVKSEFPLAPQRIIDIEIEIEGLEDGLARLQALEEELF